MEDRIVGGIISSVLGDALGVPVEFEDREYLRKNPVHDFLEFGTYNQPKGTWSDDSSLLLCTLESIIDGIDYKKTMDLFLKWYKESYWTAANEVFDIGITTENALNAYMNGCEPIKCGPCDEYSNGNGSLMRILPAAYYTFDYEEKERRNSIFNFSGLTHGHIRSKIACWLYSEIITNILHNYEKNDAVDNAFEKISTWCKHNGHTSELALFQRCQSTIMTAHEDSIKSSGYVIDSLEAALYCFLNTNTILDSLFTAINLGLDTDTIAAITGGLSGTFYGCKTLDNTWITGIKRINEIQALVSTYIKTKQNRIKTGLI